MLSEIAVTASARSPSVSWATFIRHVESTPPEKATITLPISARMRRSVSSLASAVARSSSVMGAILAGQGRARRQDRPPARLGRDRDRLGRLVARQPAELLVVDQ